MSIESSEPIEVFLFCALEDKVFLKKIEESLSGLRDKIDIWHEGKIIAGEDQAKKVNEHLNTADLILLLISPAFTNSDECDRVMLLALKREQAGKARVIPILLHPGDYKNEPFSSLGTLPANSNAITSWPKRKEAFRDVAVGVRKVVEELLKSRKVPPLPPKAPHSPGNYKFSDLGSCIRAIFLLFLIFVISGIAVLAYINSQPTIVTITPTNKTLSALYPFTAVTGAPDPAQHQVLARQISYTTPPQSRTVNATGIVQRQGLLATGTLTFYNGKIVPQLVLAGTSWIIGENMVVTDVAANIPAASPPTEGQVTVAAHAVNVGVSGNVAALVINEECCTSPPDHTIFVKNLSPFTGGKDSLSYTFVQQSDIDGAASSLEQSLTQGAQSSLQSQMRPNEALVAPPQCTNKVSSDHMARDKVDSVKVTVVITCTGEVYDKQEAEKVAANLLKLEATQSLGASYALVGIVRTTIVQVTVVNASDGTVSLQVKAEGLWVYQFDAIQKQKLAKLIAGRTLQDAIKLLKQQAGVSKVQIGGGNGTLPMDSTRIIIKIG